MHCYLPSRESSFQKHDLNKESDYGKENFNTCSEDILASSSVLTVGQTKPAQYATDMHVSDAKTTSDSRDSHGESRPVDCIDGKTKTEKKIKHGAKPAPSKEEQEFDKTLLGIFG
jgi:hypothetical protein